MWPVICPNRPHKSQLNIRIQVESIWTHLELKPLLGMSFLVRAVLSDFSTSSYGTKDVVRPQILTALAALEPDTTPISQLAPVCSV